MIGATEIRSALQCGRARCDCPRPTGLVHCPNHDPDKLGEPDLSVTDLGKLLVFCYVCGKAGQSGVVAALKARGLWVEGRERKDAPVETGRTSWEIRDAAGAVQAYHDRIDYSDGKKKFVWRRADRSSGLAGRKTETLPLYGTELLAGLASGTTIVLCEGEKAADAARRLGLIALATVTGAGNPIPNDTLLKTLTPFDIVLWPDNDGAGRAHMAEIGRRLLVLLEAQ